MKGSYGACAGQDSSGVFRLLDREVRWSRLVTFDDSAVELEEEKLGATFA